MAAMDVIITQITTLSTTNDSDLKKLKDFLRHEQETLKVHAVQIEQALLSLDPPLDPIAHTMGVAFLLSAILSAGVCQDRRLTLSFVGNFLRNANEQQLKKAVVPANTVCKCYAQMAIEEGQQATMKSIVPLQVALEKLRPNLETLTPVHEQFLRACLKSKAYHLGTRVLDQPIFDIACGNGNFSQMSPQSFLCYFYYGALIRIGMKQYAKALQLLLVVLTCPASCLSAIQADAYKKYVLVSLKVSGECPALQVYASHIIQRYAKSPSYVADLVEAYKQGDLAALKTVAEEKASLIQADNNAGLIKQVIDSLQRHKVQTLTKTYLTLSLTEIAREIGADETKLGEIDALLFDMISEGEINARIDQTTGNVSFEEDEDDMDSAMVARTQEKLAHILEVAQRMAAFEQEVVSSEAYIRKTAALEGGASGAGPGHGISAYDFMDT